MGVKKGRRCYYEIIVGGGGGLFNIARRICSQIRLGLHERICLKSKK